jgi:hypothetical protein
MSIRVDGLEGWIHTEEDFEAAGVPRLGHRPGCFGLL